jgi:hypothetical protein
MTSLISPTHSINWYSTWLITNRLFSKPAKRKKAYSSLDLLTVAAITQINILTFN